MCVVRRQIRNISAWVLIILGVPITITPIPFGLIMILTGFALLARDSRRVQEWLRRRRYYNRGFDTKVRDIRSAAPAFVRHVIDITDPDFSLGE